MRILVDADACPIPAKDILYRVSERLKVVLVMVANTPLRIPKSPPTAPWRPGSSASVSQLQYSTPGEPF